MKEQKFILGIDFGSNSARALIVHAESGDEYGSAGCVYPGGDLGIYTSSADPNLARQNPLSYLEAMAACVNEALKIASRHSDFTPANIVGIGIDATASTPVPVDEHLQPLVCSSRFAENLNAFAWMWKDHTSLTEAAQITAAARKSHPEYLCKCGGSYSSEWYWAKILHCRNIDPAVADAAYGWLDLPDFIPAVLGGITDLKMVRTGICAAGHKAFYSNEWGGYPEQDFLAGLHPALAALRQRMPAQAYPSDTVAAHLSHPWADRLGLPAGIPIAVGLIDAHSGAVGAGIGAGRMVKIIGTSSCDIITAPDDHKLADIPGICGQVENSVLPGYYGIEAGQAAVGDIFNWFVTSVCKGNHELFADLTAEAAKQQPGRHGLLALDWQNGNRNTLCDQQLTGLILGLTLHTSQADIYRALIEATAFGARRIIDQIGQYGVDIAEIVCCGGIAEKNPMLMQIYADVLNRKIRTSSSSQACALGAAIFGAVVAGVHPDAETAQLHFCRFNESVYTPEPNAVNTYCELYALYSELYDGFGRPNHCSEYGWIMKKLLEIKQRQ